MPRRFPWSDTLRHLVEYMVIRLFGFLVRLLPVRARLWVANLLGGLWFLLDRSHREKAMENLRAAWPGEEEERLRAIARSCFRGLVRSAIDVLLLHRFTLRRAARRVRIEGFEHIRAAYERGKGVLLFSAHFGCWELVPYLQAQLGLPLQVVVRPLDNPRLDALLERKRVRTGNTLLPKRDSVWPVLKLLREGQGVAIVIDQNLRGPERIFVDFLGRPAATTPALALSAIRTGAAAVPVFCVPEEDGGYTIRYEAPVEVERTGDLAHDIRLLTQRCTRVIEAYVRAWPGAWLWMHDRWRTRPGPEEEVGASDESPAEKRAGAGGGR
jgi:KDO2-lipid IV(A) lauroyltransferase